MEVKYSAGKSWLLALSVGSVARSFSSYLDGCLSKLRKRRGQTDRVKARDNGLVRNGAKTCPESYKVSCILQNHETREDKLEPVRRFAWRNFVAVCVVHLLVLPQNESRLCFCQLFICAMVQTCAKHGTGSWGSLRFSVIPTNPKLGDLTVHSLAVQSSPQKRAAGNRKASHETRRMRAAKWLLKRSLTIPSSKDRIHIVFTSRVDWPKHVNRFFDSPPKWPSQKVKSIGSKPRDAKRWPGIVTIRLQ